MCRIGLHFTLYGDRMFTLLHPTALRFLSGVPHEVFLV